MQKFAYSFAAGASGRGLTEGTKDQKELLGGKGAGLAEMSQLGIPVPPGFTITTEACRAYHQRDGEFPEGLAEQFDGALATLEGLSGKSFGSLERPLLLSVRSGAKYSMPGMMDTILNLGLNEEIVRAQISQGWDARFAWDCYRRLISMYCDVVLGVPHAGFETILSDSRAAASVGSDAELSAVQVEGVCQQFLRYATKHEKTFPFDPREQLWAAVGAVFDSWNIRRARQYRRLHGIPDDLGTAVNVQTMVFGNRGPNCATGVAFTRNPSTGEAKIYGEFLINAQGEDVVAGIRTPLPIVSDSGEEDLKSAFPECFVQLEQVCQLLEDERRDMQDVEFTVEDGVLYMLQTRDGKRSGPAAIRIAAEMVAEGKLDPTLGLARVEPDHLAQVLAPGFDPQEKSRSLADGRGLARGLPAGPGAGSGRIALTAERAAEMAADGPVILVRDETSPEDIVGMHASSGILTARGGMTSHAAVVARGLGKPCVVGAGELRIEPSGLKAGERQLEEGEWVSIDGSTGEVIAGRMETRPSRVVRALLSGEGEGREDPLVDAFVQVLSWADQVRRMRVRANADTPEDAAAAVALGAEGIGLCRTEHMFFSEERIQLVRRVIIDTDSARRTDALAQLLPAQQGDFEGIFRAMASRPVTIRLLDPPLHEFLPQERETIDQLAAELGVEASAIEGRIEEIREVNPMLGHRGCRLGITSPEIYAMQVEAIARATVRLLQEGASPRPEIMVPLVGTVEEMRSLRSAIEAVLDRVASESGVVLEIPIGTMIEVPRAALVAGKIAEFADFFSFGTNDLTQMTWGYSRDDVSQFLSEYLERGVLSVDPFTELDIEGVGQLVRMAAVSGRESRADLKLGICGEHGGDPASIAFVETCGLDYVSCSPFRVPLARLAAAKAIHLDS